MKLRDRLLDWPFPRKCLCCRRVLAAAELDLCEHCRKELPWNEQERKGDFFGRCVSAVTYTGDIRKAILRYKFYHKTALAPGLGRLLAVRIRAAYGGDFDLITWVPISRRRRWQRGYDQTWLLAKTVAAEFDKPLYRTLKKIRHNRPQSGMPSAAARRGNVLNVYAADHPENFRGKRVLLLDDVVTTGATLSEAARILRTAGASSVICATAAAAERQQ